jgi:hypothetical protein
VVFPGETLSTRVWRDGPRLAIATSTVERDTPVLSNGRLTVS